MRPYSQRSMQQPLVQDSRSRNDIPLLSVDQFNDGRSVSSVEGWKYLPSSGYSSSLYSNSAPLDGRNYGMEEGLLPNDGIPLRHAHLDLNWSLFISAVLTCGLTSYYAYNATLARSNPWFIPQNPEYTIGILNALSTASIFLLGELVQAVFERTRWIFSSRLQGIGMREFLGMSRATSILGVFALLCWKKKKGNSRTRSESSDNKFWIVKRYVR